jgi:hypothetical protein
VSTSGTFSLIVKACVVMMVFCFLMIFSIVPALHGGLGTGVAALCHVGCGARKRGSVFQRIIGDKLCVYLAGGFG